MRVLKTIYLALLFPFLLAFLLCFRICLEIQMWWKGVRLPAEVALAGILGGYRIHRQSSHTWTPTSRLTRALFRLTLPRDICFEVYLKWRREAERQRKWNEARSMEDR